VLVLEQEKASKVKSIVVEDGFRHFQLKATINTSEYRLNVFGSRLVICSSDSLHKYQLDKIKIQDFALPLPATNLELSDIIPLHVVGKDSNTTDFVVIYREEQLDLDKKFDQVELYLASFSPKYLLKKLDLDLLHVNY
jgi:hypothetical protein